MVVEATVEALGKNMFFPHISFYLGPLLENAAHSEARFLHFGR